MSLLRPPSIYVLLSGLVLTFSAPAQNIRTVNLKATDLAYHPESGVLYAAVPKQGPTAPAFLGAIEPYSGTFAAHALADNPGTLLVVSNYLYVASTSTNRIFRYHLPSLELDISWSLGEEPFYGPLYARSMEAFLNDPRRIAVSLHTHEVTPSQRRVVVFLDGTALPQQDLNGGSTRIFINRDGSRLYGLYSEAYPVAATRFSISTNGIRRERRTTISQTPLRDARWEDGLLFLSPGGIAHADDSSIFQADNLINGEPCVDPAGSRFFYVFPRDFGSAFLRVFNLQTFNWITSITVPNANSPFHSVTRWGTNGVAFSDTNRIVLVQADVFPKEPSADLALHVTSALTEVTASSNLTYFVNVTNQGPNSATNVTVRLTLPEQTTNTTVVVSSGAAVDGTFRAGFDLDRLDPGESATATITVRTTSLIFGTNKSTVLHAYARVSSDAIDPEADDNQQVIGVTAIPLPAISIANAVVTEHHNGTNIQFQVALSRAASVPIEVDYYTAPSNATAAVDYVPTTGRLLFNPGETNQVVSINILDDDIDEYIERFHVVLTNASNAIFGDGIAHGSIEDDDLWPEASINDVVVMEGDSGVSEAEFTITLSRPSDLQPSVRLYRWSPEGGAEPGVDYAFPLTRMIVFSPGVTRLTWRPLIFGDKTVESNEWADIGMLAGNNVAIGKGRGTLTIQNDDGLAGGLDHFSWSFVPSPQVAGQWIGATIQARDATGAFLPNVSEPISIAARSPESLAIFGPGIGHWNYPFYAESLRSRAQVIYPAVGIQRAGLITALDLRVESASASPMENWVIRMKHSAARVYLPGDTFDNAGWTTVYATNVVVLPGWLRFQFSEPFAYDGVNSLFVDFSHRNNVPGDSSYCGYINESAALRSLFLSSAPGDPTNWGGSEISRPYRTSWFPEARFSFQEIGHVSTATHQMVLNGIWSGSIAVSNLAGTVTLTTATVSDRSGSSNPFTLLSSTDGDGDGLPDSWESHHFGNNSGLPNWDSDKDGASDASEFRAGTDPKSAASTFKIRDVRHESAGVRISIQSVPAREYRAEASDNVFGPWAQVGPRFISDSALSENLIPTSTNQLRFFRVVSGP